jgi:hypothetical protein
MLSPYSVARPFARSSLARNWGKRRGLVCSPRFREIGPPTFDAFEAELRGLGWRPGENIAFEYRGRTIRPSAFPTLRPSWFS